MTRNQKSKGLKVYQVSFGNYLVESSKGDMCYKVALSNGHKSCTCPDYRQNCEDAEFACKHILAAMNGSSREISTDKPKLDERFIIRIEGRDFVTYPGLLDLGHQKGLARIEVETLQIPSKENGDFAICKAIVESKSGEVFVDVGDATPDNCNKRVSRHLLRMAGTRAIARALRTFTNIGMTCLEELEETENLAVKEPVKPAQKSKTSSTDKSKSTDKAKMSEAQKNAIYNLAERRGISSDELEKRAEDAYGVGIEHLCATDASSFIRNLQQAV